jgi:L,D-transpeptidase ErfK/SrfK
MKGLLTAPILAGLLAMTGPARQAMANEYELRAGDDVVGTVVRLRAEARDTFVDIAQRHGVGFDEMGLANPGVDAWLPRAGTPITVPTRFVLPDAPRQGVVLNYPPARGYGPTRVLTFPVSVGRLDWQTPLGTTKVVRKITDPIWTPPESIRREHAEQGEVLPAQVPPGPDNPLGPFALYLGVPGYLLHGTDERKQSGIGIVATHGCVRLYNEDVATLYRSVPVGTPVHIIDQPYKAGWQDGVLYFEAHPPFGADAEGELGHLTRMVQLVMEATRDHPDYPVDWQKAEAEVLKPSGIPVPIGPTLADERAPASTLSPGAATRQASPPPPPNPAVSPLSGQAPTKTSTPAKNAAPPKRGPETSVRR